MDQGGAPRIRKLSRRRPVHLSRRTDDRGGRAARRISPSRCTASAPVYLKSLAFNSNAFRVVYAVQLADEIWVVHALKKSTKGIRTPKHEIDLIRNRLKRLKEMLK
jgi:hypothetical protein